VTCSCSYHVSTGEFIEVVAQAARDMHRNLRILENRAVKRRTILYCWRFRRLGT
jgi:23S rRNA G2069 N7-methylase RlmK/C1962 C5-methylase RlmI